MQSSNEAGLVSGKARGTVGGKCSRSSKLGAWNHHSKFL
nr:MAG TPA: hypothetical protein [Caudoviricetes sp.]